MTNSAASSIADAVVESIVGNLDPEDVFDKQVIFNHVKSNYTPGDVFDENDLATWALENGFIRE